MAYFFAEAGLDVGGYITERGFLLYGGEAADDTPLDDLWLFDLSRRGHATCDWVLLDDDATDTLGVAGGAFVFDDSLDRFWLIGGRRADSAGWRPVEDLYKMDDLTQGFVVDRQLSMDTYSVLEELGDPRCAWSNDPDPPPGDYWECRCQDSVNGCETDAGVQVSVGAVMGEWSAGIEPDEGSIRRAICEQSHEAMGTTSTPDWHRHSGDETCAANPIFGTGCDADPFCDDAPREAGIMGRFEDTVEQIGRQSAAWAWDPLNHVLLAHGGSVGCEGASACSATTLEGVFLAREYDGISDARHAVNEASVTSMSPPSMVYYDEGTPMPWVEYGGWSNTRGVRAAAGAFLGLSWDFNTKAYVDTGIRYAAWGGTLHQELEPSWAYELDDLENFSTGSWYDLYGLGDGATAGSQVLTGTYTLRTLEPTGWFDLAAASQPGVYDAALVRMGASHVVAIGGRDGADQAVDTIQVFDDLGTLVQLWTGYEAFGARGVYDPVEQRAWIFGLFDSGDTLVSVQDLQGLPYAFERGPADVELLRLEQDVRFEAPSVEPATDPWTLSAGARFEVSFDTAPDNGFGVYRPGYTQRIHIELPGVQGLDAAGLENVLVDAELLIDGEVVPLDLVDEEVPFDLDGVLSASSPLLPFFSPVILVEGAEYDLRVILELNPNDGSGEEGQTHLAVGAAVSGDGSECDGALAVRLAKPVALVKTESGQFTHSSTAFAGARYGLPAPSWAVASVGTPDDACTVAGTTILEPADGICRDLSGTFQRSQLVGHSALMMETANYDRELVLWPTPQNALYVNVWVDTCLTPEVQAHIDEYLSGTHETVGGPSLAGDIDFVVERLGFGRRGGQPDQVEIETRAALVFRRGDEASSEVGMFSAGLVQVMPFDGVGDAPVNYGASDPDETPTILSAVVTHEATHFMLSRRLVPHWADEGLAVLNEMHFYADLQPTKLYRGLYWRVHGWLREGEDHLLGLRNLTQDPHPDVRFEALYEVAPYVLSQAMAARYGTTAEDFWDDVQGQIAEADVEWLSEVGATEWNQLLGASFYGERVEGASVGEPLVGMTGQDLDGGVSGQVTIRQIQNDGTTGRLVTDLGKDFQLFHDVPFILACGSLEQDEATGFLETTGPRPFNECDADKADVFSIQVLSPEGAGLEQSRTISLTASAGMETDTGDAAFSDTGVVPFEASTQVVGVALLAHHQLLQDWIGLYGIIGPNSLPPAEFLTEPVAVTWQLACGRGSRAGTHVFAGCLADADGDGWPVPGDCNDGVSTAFPGAADPVGFWQEGDPLHDIDCDTWPVDFWSHSPVP